MSPSGRADKLRSRLTINPDDPPPAAPVARPDPAPPVAAEPEPPARPVATPRKPARPRATPPPRLSASEGPDITPGRMYYRSFYLEDTTFARYRAAVYWLARNPRAAAEVPENMSQGIAAYMEQVADDLEARFNDGDEFPAPPAPRRRRKTGQ